MNSKLALLGAVSILSACSSQLPVQSEARGRTPTATRLTELGGVPCQAHPDWTCVTLKLPLDHFAAPGTDDRRIDFTFSVHPATGERRGTFLMIFGGPGSTGVAKDLAFQDIDPRIVEQYDVVHFDLRGVGTSGQKSCVAATKGYNAARLAVRSAAEETALEAAAKAFADDCVAEMGLPRDELRFYSTKQAAEDVEAMRVALLGDEPWVAYGRSYGTQLGQTYAASHAEHLQRLVIDGVIDLTVGLSTWQEDRTWSHEDIVARMLADCAKDAGCAADFGGDPAGKVDALIASLRAAPRTVAFPLPNGGAAERVYNWQDLDATIAGALEPAEARGQLLRALAQAARFDDLVPLMRVRYAIGGYDELTGDAIDSGGNSAIYYLFTCNDYTEQGTPFAIDHDEFMARGRALVQRGLRVVGPYFDALTCAYWPRGNVELPLPPLALPAVPTLVAHGTGDASTPVKHADALVSRLADGYDVRVDGAHHLIMTSGIACAEKPIAEFIVSGTPPAERHTLCVEPFTAPRAPLVPQESGGIATAAALMEAADAELSSLPEYLAWDRAAPLAVGCRFGGTVTFTAQDKETVVNMAGCVVVKGLALAGSGKAGPQALELTVDVQGERTGALKYVRAGDHRETTGELTPR